MVVLENLSDERITTLRHAAHMEEFGNVLEVPPTLQEISSMALEISVLRRAPKHDLPVGMLS